MFVWVTRLYADMRVSRRDLSRVGEGPPHSQVREGAVTIKRSAELEKREVAAREERFPAGIEFEIGHGREDGERAQFRHGFENMMDESVIVRVEVEDSAGSDAF